MSEQSGPLPQRIGDAERDRAAELLRDHLTEGRLDQTEFDERLTAALTAKTAADLEPLFADLPGPRPGSTVVPSNDFQPPPWQAATSDRVAARAVGTPPVPGQGKNRWAVAASVAWPLAIIACFAIGWEYWWLILIPIFLSSMHGKTHNTGHSSH